MHTVKSHLFSTKNKHVKITVLQKSFFTHESEDAEARKIKRDTAQSGVKNFSTYASGNESNLFQTSISLSSTLPRHCGIQLRIAIIYIPGRT